MSYGLALGAASFGSGWDALGYAILGLMGGFAITIGTELYFVGSWLRINPAIKVIKESYGKDGRKLDRIVGKLKKHRPDLADYIDSSWVAGEVKKINENGAACDGSLKRKLRSQKIKHRIAYYRDILRYLKKEMVTQFGERI